MQQRMKFTCFFHCAIYNEQKEVLHLEVEKQIEKQENNLVLKFIVEHYAHKLANYFAKSFAKRTELL